MEGRKWEELNMDCLVNVLGRLGMESLLFDIPFVCKSWYKATLNPLCWQRLDFSENSISPGKLNGTGLFKLVVNRSSGSAVSLVLPSYCTTEAHVCVGGSAVSLVLPGYCMTEALVCVAEGCPTLKYLKVPYQFIDDMKDMKDMSIFASLISKWKNLEVLRLGSSIYMEAILTQVSLHCKDFVGLGISGAYIGKNEARVLVTLLPNIKYLALRQASLERENLVIILKGCKKLEHFDARDCEGYECDDEILNLASHIPNFMYEGSIEWIPDYEDYHIDGEVFDGYSSG